MSLLKVANIYGNNIVALVSIQLFGTSTYLATSIANTFTYFGSKLCNNRAPAFS